VEADKAELLKETGELIGQIAELRKELNASQHSVQEAMREKHELDASLESARQSRNAFESRLSVSAKKEKDLHDLVISLETKLRQAEEEHEAALKDSKKDTIHTVMDLTSKVKSAANEIEVLRTRCRELTEAEKRAFADVDKLRVELDSVTRSHESMAQSMAEEMAVVKRENREAKMKIGLMTERKSRTDVEMMSAQVELTRSENEIARLVELLKEAESRLQSSEDKMAALKAELDAVTQAYNRLKVKAVDLEEAMLKKNKLVDKQSKDLSRLERDGIAEVKRLRLLLTTAEGELIEMKPLVSSLQKELADGKANFSKLQGTTNSTVNGLLEELRSTEDALTAERKRGQADLEATHSRIVDLQNSLERAREQVEESNHKKKTDRNEKVCFMYL
jgi:chromosome segregation ATPase